MGDLSGAAHGQELRPSPAHKGQDVVFREATFQVAREILEPHNFMLFSMGSYSLIFVTVLRLGIRRPGPEGTCCHFHHGVLAGAWDASWYLVGALTSEVRSFPTQLWG